MRYCLMIGAVLLMSALVSAAAAEATLDTLHYSIGLKYFQEKQYDKAVESFEKMLTRYPDHAPSYYRLGLCWRAQDKNALAAYNFRKATRYDAANPEMHRVLSEALFANDEAEAAMGEMRRAAELEPDPKKKAEDDSRAGQMLASFKQRSSALKVATAAPTPSGTTAAEAVDSNRTASSSSKPEPGLPPAGMVDKTTEPSASAETSADTMMTPILRAYNAGERDQTLSACRDLLKRKPGHAGAYYYAGVVRFEKKEYDKAAYNLQRAFGYPEKGYNAHYYLGLIAERTGRRQEAVREYDRYIKLTKSDAGKRDAVSRRDRLLRDKPESSPSEALPVAEKADAAASGSESSFRMMVTEDFPFIIEDTLSPKGRKMLSALDLFLDEKYDAALKILKEFYRDNPRDPLTDNALYGLGLIYYRMRLFDEAASYLGRVVTDYPNGDVAKSAELLRARLWAERGGLDSAVASFDCYLKKFPRDAHYAYANTALGDIAFSRNDPQEALKYYLKALGAEERPDRKTDLHFKIGESYFRQGSDRGIDYFMLAANADSTLNSHSVMESCFRLGDYYFRSKNLESALKYYRQAVARFPTSSHTAWAQYQIGNIYKMGGQYEPAIKTYQALIDAFPDDYWALQAKWKKDDAVWENEYREVLK